MYSSSLEDTLGWRLYAVYWYHTDVEEYRKMGLIGVL